MSTQLILYPQSYGGQFNSTSRAVFNQYLVNGLFFTGLSSATLYNTTASYPAQDAIINSAPASLGNWYRYTTTGGAWGNVPAPIVTSNKLVLSYNATVGHTGVYQKLSGLIVGAQYQVIINIDTYAGGAADLLTLEFYSGNVIQYNQSFGSNVSTIEVSYTANSTNDTFLIDYESTVGTLTIGSISITEDPRSPTLVYSNLEDGQVICDLYAEEDIPLTLSIDDFKSVAEKVQSYSKDFNLPATKRNNQIFNNMFEITRADDGLIFNPYAKTQCILKQDGFVLFEGYLRLINIKDNEGEISYNVNLYSEVIALADILKAQTFAELDFDELSHGYNYTEIRNSWEGILTVDPLPISSFANNTGVAGATTTNVLKYPFIDWNHQYALTPNPVLSNLESSFRPCIKLKYLINKIFAATNQFNWTSNFFDSADFGKLYMDFNWGADTVPFTIDESGLGKPLVSQLATTSFVTIESADNNYNPNIGYSGGIYTALLDNQTYIMDYFYLYLTGGAFTAEFRWKMVKGGVTSYINLTPVSGSGGVFSSSAGNFTEVLNTGDTLTPEFKSATAATATFSVLGMDSFLGTSATTVVTSASAAANNTFLQTLRGELGQWDFLKGIMTMFNLVSMVDETDPNNILIEPYSDIFITNPNSTPLDWTDKIDVSQMELNPLTDLNKNTIFKFVEDDDDHAFNVYKNNLSGHLYGSKKIDGSTATNGMSTVLEGTKEIIAEPFAATVSIPLMPQFPDFIVPSIYSTNDDGTCEGFENEPRIFYDNYIKTLTTCTYDVPIQNGVPGDDFEDEFLQFSHLSTIPSVSLTTTDFVFESQQLLPAVGTPPTDNLYNTYWQPYINELYNPNTRTMTIKVNLTPADLNTFKFYDTVFIKNRTFRVNTIQYKPNDLATVEFILIA
jgi:hypothetical protein